MTTSPEPNKLRERVVAAAEAALAANGSVGPLELLQNMGLLPSSHMDEWRRGRMETLERSIQGSPEKLSKSFRFFEEWAAERGFKKVQGSYFRAGRTGPEPLRVTESGDAAREKFFRTHYAPRDLPPRKAERLQAKLNKAPDLVVFQTVAESVICSECKREMTKGNFLFMEKGNPLCLACADLDRLEFLPSGNTAMSRRARKYSPLSAVVVRFHRRRGHYERQGLLVSPEAIARAEADCLADAPERAVQRAESAERRRAEDEEFVRELTDAIRQQYPRCPSDEALEIARHAAERGSGRIGRSAAGRALDPMAVELAVMAHVRHVHTNYDQLLMEGTDRQDARALVRAQMDEVLRRWTKSES